MYSSISKVKAAVPAAPKPAPAAPKTQVPKPAATKPSAQVAPSGVLTDATAKAMERSAMSFGQQYAQVL